MIFINGRDMSGLPTAPAYFIKCKCPDAVRGQLHRVQQRDLDEAVGLRASGRPVLVTFHLRTEMKIDTLDEVEHVRRLLKSSNLRQSIYSPASSCFLMICSPEMIPCQSP